MNHTQQNLADTDCVVTVSISERDGQTRATARLRLGDAETVGAGLSRLGPSERGAAGIGRDLAVARALSDLAHRMMAVTANDIENLTATAATSSHR